MKLKNLCALALSCGLGMLGFATPAHADKAHPLIGFSIDDMRLERWARDRDFFNAAATKLGAKVLVQSANGSEERQVAQIENMISRGVDVLVIVPQNSKVLGNVIAEAHRNGVKVLSYDRLILDADIDAYISFDNLKVGQMQAQGLVDVKPKGNYFLLGGAPTDNNAKVLRQGQMQVLKPLIDKGDIKVVGDQWVPDWSPAKALSIIEDALTANANRIDAVVASNDAIAGGAVQALAAQRLAGKVAVSGQDADLAGVKRVVAGTQTMTVYKPLDQLATQAAGLAMGLATGKTPVYNAHYENGKKSVNTILLQPIDLTRAKVDKVISDGFYTHQQVYGN